eukprot:TRINITY_DN8694_c0_g1_i3.p1 TRINITY_DN8694_c0_g1~~TRINITY_DN8694_c0_g1_i3.p1  ORF type:complete len:338 (+),score=17.51 TRINITY_DN8694_c0_g1_i3:44-1057(+)
MARESARKEPYFADELLPKTDLINAALKTVISGRFKIMCAVPVSYTYNHHAVQMQLQAIACWVKVKNLQNYVICILDPENSGAPTIRQEVSADWDYRKDPDNGKLHRYTPHPGGHATILFSEGKHARAFGKRVSSKVRQMDHGRHRREAGRNHLVTRGSAYNGQRRPDSSAIPGARSLPAVEIADEQFDVRFLPERWIRLLEEAGITGQLEDVETRRFVVDFVARQDGLAAFSVAGQSALPPPAYALLNTTQDSVSSAGQVSSLPPAYADITRDATVSAAMQLLESPLTNTTQARTVSSPPQPHNQDTGDVEPAQTNANAQLEGAISTSMATAGSAP